MPRTDAGTDADHLRVVLLVLHDFVEQWQHGLVAAVHYRQAADLNHVEIGQDGAHGRFRLGNQFLVNQRLAHQPRVEVLRAGLLVHAGALLAAPALKMTVPTGSPSRAAVNWPGLRPLTN